VAAELTGSKHRAQSDASDAGTEIRYVQLRFQIAERTLHVVTLRLHSQTFSLAEILSNVTKDVPPLSTTVQGVCIRSIPVSKAVRIRKDCPSFLVHEQQRYPRYYIRMHGSFDDYLFRLSRRTKSTISRKTRKWTELAHGTLDVREYRTPSELYSFHQYAREISCQTYQERLLNAGLPNTKDHIKEMRQRAAAGIVRAYLLFYDEKPVSYLYLPVDDGCLIYAYLGYQSAFSAYSPGVVLQFEALKRLFAEQRFWAFDFTEGEGQHKRVLATDHVECCNLFLLPPMIRNRLLLLALRSFDRIVGTTSDLADRIGAKNKLRRMLR
jgi:hypothetical protein